MKKFFALAFLLMLTLSLTNARAEDPSGISAGLSTSVNGAGILSFFGIGGMSCYSQPETNCDDNPDSGLFNSIACKVMKSFNGSVVPLYCNIIANPAYLGALDAAMILYVTILGFSFLTGIAEVEIGVVIGKIIKMSVVYMFAVNADIYFQIVYNTVLSTPETLVRLMLSASQGSGGTDITGGTSGGAGSPQNFFQFVDQGIYKIMSNVVTTAYNEASGATYGKSNLKVVILGLALWQIGGDVVGGLFMTVVVGWIVAYFGIMIRYLLAQLSLMFLLMLGPLFIPFFLFKRFEEMAMGWVRMMISFIVQIVLVVGFVIMVQHFFVDFYNIVKKGMDASPMQESTCNHLVQYADGTYHMESKPCNSNAAAETEDNQALGGDWKGKMPGFTVQLLVMGVIVFCASQFLAFVPTLANLISFSPASPQILGGDLGKRKVDLFGQHPEPPPHTTQDFLLPAFR